MGTELYGEGIDCDRCIDESVIGWGDMAAAFAAAAVGVRLRVDGALNDLFQSGRRRTTAGS